MPSFKEINQEDAKCIDEIVEDTMHVVKSFREKYAVHTLQHMGIDCKMDSPAYNYLIKKLDGLPNKY